MLTTSAAVGWMETCARTIRRKLYGNLVAEKKAVVLEQGEPHTYLPLGVLQLRSFFFFFYNQKNLRFSRVAYTYYYRENPTRSRDAYDNNDEGFPSRPFFPHWITIICTRNTCEFRATILRHCRADTIEERNGGRGVRKPFGKRNFY